MKKETLNGYKILANGYRQLRETVTCTEEERQAIERRIKALETVADLTQAELYALWETGAFNEIIAEKLNCVLTDESRETQQRIMGKYRALIN